LSSVTKSLLRALLVTMILIVATPLPSMAYIDPNTGGMLFQILAAVFGSLSVIVLVFSRQIRSLVARIGRAFRREPVRGPQPIRASGHKTGNSAEASPPAERLSE
jgi:hypothetical protein